MERQKAWANHRGPPPKKGGERRRKKEPSRSLHFGALQHDGPHVRQQRLIRAHPTVRRCGGPGVGRRLERGDLGVAEAEQQRRTGFACDSDHHGDDVGVQLLQDPRPQARKRGQPVAAGVLGGLTRGVPSEQLGRELDWNRVDGAAVVERRPLLYEATSPQVWY